jgi:hypothetical protein
MSRELREGSAPGKMAYRVDELKRVHPPMHTKLRHFRLAAEMT